MAETPPRYYLDKTPEEKTGLHVLHTEFCSKMPEVTPQPTVEGYMFLGRYYDCEMAMDAGKRYFAATNGCEECTPDCYVEPVIEEPEAEAEGEGEEVEGEEVEGAEIASDEAEELAAQSMPEEQSE